MDSGPGRYSVVRLPHFWYVACRSAELRAGPITRTVLGTPLAMFRDGTGAAAVLVDRCPHRNVPLSLGRVRDGCIECRYHGWRFDSAGECRAVPGLDGEPDRKGRRATTVAAVEQDGLVWVWPASDAVAGGEGPVSDERPPPLRLPHAADPSYVTVLRSRRVTATMHAALENTLDVPHTAFLHGGLFRGGREPVEVEVVVRHGGDRVEAEYLGEPRPEGLAGRILAPEGGVVTHVDRFILPSIAQVEYRLGDRHLVVTSAFTPVGDFDTALHAAVSLRAGLPAPVVRAVLTPIANRIFAQDAAILRHQAESVQRFGGEHFASTDLDVLGQHMLRMLRRAERGEPGDGGPVPPEQRVRMRV